MRMTRWTAAIALAGCALAQTAVAAIVSGSFSGTAEDGLIFGPGPITPTFAGAAVQGTFRIDTSLLGPQTPDGDDSATYALTGDALLLSFTLLGQTYRFGDQGLRSQALVFTGSGGQVLTFAANVLGNSTPTAILRFGASLPAGAAGVWVDGLDLTTFHASPIAPEFLSADFQLQGDVGATIALTALRFDDAAQVPEPATWALLLAGAALLARRTARPPATTPA